MKRTLLVLVTVIAAASAQDNLDQLANRIVNSSARIKPGQVVVVAGGKHTVPVMEAVASEAQKAGGMVTMFLNSDRLIRSRLAEAPEKYLEQEPRFIAEWLKHIDVWIALPPVEDPKSVFADIPEPRLAKNAKAGRVIDDMLNSSRVRGVFIGYPTPELARSLNIDSAALQKMHWAAVNADYQQISDKGNRLKDMLSGAKVRVTSPSGTDLTFSVGNRPVILDDGIATEQKSKAKLVVARSISLPGGQVYVAPNETSANGKVAIPRTLCKFQPLVNATFRLKDGKLEDFRAEDGASCFEQTIAAYAGPKDRFGYFSIGLNPELKVVENPGDYRPSRAAGMVWIGVGDNRLLNGANNTEGGFTFPIANATVELNGKAVVKDGTLLP
jgi:aminopeptidase